MTYFEDENTQNTDENTGAVEGTEETSSETPSTTDAPATDAPEGGAE